MLSVRLAPELMARLQTLADKTGRTKSFYAREAIAIARYLEDMEDTFEEEQDLSLVDVTRRVRQAFDIDRVTKRFYDRGASLRTWSRPTRVVLASLHSQILGSPVLGRPDDKVR
jgi:RHH-type transcriptional regulator, rel operon repressor / antitoxin RelB